MNLMSSQDTTESAESLLDRIVYGIASTLEKRRFLAVTGYAVLFLAVCALLSATKLLWYDEMATYYPATLPTASAVIDFFQQGNDVHTPMASLITYAVIHMFGDGPIVARLPFTLGYLTFCICIFIFVARRCPAVYASAAMIFPTLTLMFLYANELRCYGLVIGLAGVALIAWQAATGGSSRGLPLAALWFSLAGAMSLHYYAVFLLIPFGLAELTRTWIRKRIDWPVWSVLISSLFVLLIFLPGMRAAQALYPKELLPNQPHLGQIPVSYLALLSISNAPILGAIIAGLLLAPKVSRVPAGGGAPHSASGMDSGRRSSTVTRFRGTGRHGDRSV